MAQETYSNVVYIPDSFVKGGSATSKDRRNWVKCWAQLKAFKLKFWTSSERQAEEREADYCVDINRVNIAAYMTSETRALNCRGHWKKKRRKILVLYAISCGGRNFNLHIGEIDVFFWKIIF